MARSEKACFREHVKEKVQRELDQTVDGLDPIRRSHWMTRAYVEEVLHVLYPGMLPEDRDDMKHCYVDGSKDAGADFICRVDGVVTIIQAKYRGPKVDESAAEFDSFCDILARLHPDVGTRVPKNAPLREILDEIDWQTDTFDLQFITLGKVNESMRSREEQGQRGIKGLQSIEDRVEVALLDEQDLNDRLRDAISATEGVQKPVAIRFAESYGDGPPWIKYETEGGRCAWIGMVTAKHLSELREFRNRLFALNIRNYIGDNRTNSEMQGTAIREPENFFFYNNGISAVATRVDESASVGRLECTQFSVINGAQTFRSLLKAQKKNPREAGEARVLLRVTEVALTKKGDDSNFIDSITRFNNTQNAVRVSDFRSNDPVQRALNKRFAQLSRSGGRQYLYKNKRSDDRSAGRIIVPMEEFAMTVYAFRHGPVDGKGGKQYLFDTSPKGGYAKLFGADGVVWQGLTEEDFGLLAGEWLVCAESREVLGRLKDEAIAKASADLAPIVRSALERRWMWYFALGEMLRIKYLRAGGDLEKDLCRLSNPKWLDEAPEKGVRGALAKYCLAVREVLIRVYKSSMRDTSFVQRNWYRSDQTLLDIRQDLEFADTLLDGLDLVR